ncbi:hypothetical protein TWF694_004722 [Orbilia ellipsospora]|uniref:Uncharacterized protein n=1 Tax=Orbilia ellipsospora TaxID=2528407 RepID=A0AAV9WW52_9PEZI
MHYLLILSLLSTAEISSGFRIQFKYAENDEILPLAPAAQWSPRNPECRFITGSDGHNVDFMEVQNMVPAFGDAPGGIAFYTNAENCANSDPTYIVSFYSIPNSIQRFIPIQAVEAGGNLQGEWTFGDNNDLPKITYWKNVIPSTFEDAFIDEFKIQPGTSLILFHEGWAVQEDGVDVEPLPASMSVLLENSDNTTPPPDNVPEISMSPALGIYITSQVQEPDGTRITLFSDGTSQIRIPGGLLVRIQADGTAEATQTGANGFYMEFDPELGVQIRDRAGRDIFLSPEELNQIDLLYESGALTSRERFTEAISSIQSGFQHLNVDSPHALDFLKYMDFDPTVLQSLDRAWNPLQPRPANLQISNTKEPEIISPDFGGNRPAPKVGGSPVLTRMKDAAVGAYNWLTRCPKRKDNFIMSSRIQCSSVSQGINIEPWDNSGFGGIDVESNTQRLARVHPASGLESSHLANRPDQRNGGSQTTLTFGHPESLSPNTDSSSSGSEDGGEPEVNFTFENRASPQEIEEEDGNEFDDRELYLETWQNPQAHFQGDSGAEREREDEDVEGGPGQLEVIDELDEFEDLNEKAGEQFFRDMAARFHRTEQEVRSQSQPDQDPADLH